MSILEDIKAFFKDHQDKFILTIGFILICFTSFAAGRLSISSESEPVEIDSSNILADNNIETKEEEIILEDNNKDILENIENEGVFVGDVENNKFYPFNSKEVGDIPEDNKMWFDSQEEAIDQGYLLANQSISNTKSSSSSNTTINCKYVGSKNSDKYHLPDSGSAKRIKEENKVCFSSQEDAEDEGYTAGSSVKD